MAIKKWAFLTMVLWQGAQAQPPPILPPFQPTDSAVVVISTRYQPNSFLRLLFMGSNYRREWATPVKLPVLQLSKTPFTVKELGGGQQTRSLKLNGPGGREWSLRSVDKYPAAALPPFARKTIARRVTEDFISAAFPYGSVLSGELAFAAGVIAPRPRMFLVRSDKAFGQYDSLFAGTVCTLEEREPGFKKTESSADVLDDIHESTQYRIDQPALLKARLMDMLMADWDRHSDNWSWGEKDAAANRTYYAIPRDRDWAFYRSRGLLTRLARMASFGFLSGFKLQSGHIKDISYKAWRIDRTFLNELDRSGWERIIAQIQSEITDGEVDSLLRLLPPPVYTLQAERFALRLKTRRNNLMKDVMPYYRFLAGEVAVNGTAAADVFTITPIRGGMTIRVESKDSSAATVVHYQRVFADGETVFVTLNGFDGADSFQVNTGAASRIRLIIYGGEGNDRYNITGSIRTTVNDSPDGATVLQKGKAKFKLKQAAAFSSLP